MDPRATQVVEVDIKIHILLMGIEYDLSVY